MVFQLIKCQSLLSLKYETDSGVLFQFPDVGNEGPREPAVWGKTSFNLEIDCYYEQRAQCIY